MDYSPSDWIDMRWSETGWCEVFRLRLFGWLPSKRAENCIAMGVLERQTSQPRGLIALSDQGRRITDMPEFALNQDNFTVLADVLQVKGYEPAWALATPEQDHVLLPDRDQFEAQFKFGILNALGHYAARPD